MTSETQNTPNAKKPYSAPRLVVHSLAALAVGADVRNSGDGLSAAGSLSSPVFQPSPLVIEGFPGKVEELVQVLSSIRLRSRQRSDSEAASRETAPGKPVSGRIHVLLMDMRRHVPGTRQALTRLELDGDLSAVLILVLTNSGEDSRVSAEIRRSDRWHFIRLTAAEDLGVLVRSLFQAPAARAHGA